MIAGEQKPQISLSTPYCATVGLGVFILLAERKARRRERFLMEAKANLVQTQEQLLEERNAALERAALLEEKERKLREGPIETS